MCPRGEAKQSWERLPLALLAAVVIMVIQGSSVFAFDRKQRATSNQNTTAWIRHFAKHMYKDVLPNLPGHFGTEYIHGSGQEQEDDGSLRVNHEMLYEIAGVSAFGKMSPYSQCTRKSNSHCPYYWFYMIALNAILLSEGQRATFIRPGLLGHQMHLEHQCS